MKNCPHCQFQNDDNAKFCSNCGAPFQTQSEQNNQQTAQQQNYYYQTSQQQYQQPNQYNGQSSYNQAQTDFIIRQEEKKQNKKGIGCLVVMFIFLGLIALSGIISSIPEDDGGAYTEKTTQEQTTEATTTEDQFKDNCDSYTYEEIARNPEKYKGKNAKFTGEVIQVIESGNNITMRVNITAEENEFAENGYIYSDTIYVSYRRQSENESRVLEDDIITLYGTLDGLETYSSIFGESISLPSVKARYIEL